MTSVPATIRTWELAPLPWQSVPFKLSAGQQNTIFLGHCGPMHKRILTFLFLLAWLAALLCALWWYQSRYFRAFDPDDTWLAGQQLQLPEYLAGEGPIRLLHFWEPACPCNAGNQQHLAKIMHEFAADVQFYHVQKAGTKGQLAKPLRAMQAIAEIPGSQQLPASPAVAIFDRQGRLAYFGPYSEGAICTSSNSFVEPILDALRQGRAVAANSTLANGCFCDWQ